MTSHRTGTEPKPAVWSFFQNQQNLMRLLASLSQFTGDGKYVHAAGEAAEYMFNHYWYPESGVLHWGGHGYVDLVTGNRYGMKGVVHEIEDVYPYWELLRAVDPDRGEMLMKGYLGSEYQGLGRLYTTTATAISENRVDHANTWNRPWDGLQRHPKSVRISRLSVWRSIWLTPLTAWATKSRRRHRGCGRNVS